MSEHLFRMRINFENVGIDLQIAITQDRIPPCDVLPFEKNSTVKDPILSRQRIKCKTWA